MWKIRVIFVLKSMFRKKKYTPTDLCMQGRWLRTLGVAKLLVTFFFRLIIRVTDEINIDLDKGFNETRKTISKVKYR